MESPKLTAELIKGFAGSLLSKRFDNLVATPDFHEQLWDLCCSDYRQIAIAAPRGHAKSTAVTHSFVLASVLFRSKSYVIIVSDTVGQASQFLHDIKMELIDNDDLQDLFEVEGLEKDTEEDIIVKFRDGHKARIQAKGSEQKMRGLKWMGQRPDLIVGDDLENDEIVMNQERREKFRRWFYGALLPALSDKGQVRIVGTILHLDALLERLMPSETAKDTIKEPLRSYSLDDTKPWVSYRYRAHSSDGKEFLWPEKFTPERLIAIRKDYVSQGFPEGYAQEYLNYPIDESTSFFRRSDLRPMSEDDWKKPKKYYAAVDFAISDKERADFTVIAVCGVDSDGTMHIVDMIRDRLDAKGIIDAMFGVQKDWSPEIFTVETGAIDRAIGPFLNDEMVRRNMFININKETPVKDKQSRARSIQGRLRAHNVKFDVDSMWYDQLEEEMLTFPRGRHDDQVDALSWLGLTVDKFIVGQTEQELEEEEWENEYLEASDHDTGRSFITGY